MQFYERSYEEVLDDVLTALVGGVVNEAKVYVAGQDVYPLDRRDQRRVEAVRAIVGTVAADDQGLEERFTFTGGVDFELNEEQGEILWLDGTRPLDGTTFYVDYYLEPKDPPLTDINVGSVVRTIAEAMSREIATVYQQINLAYLSGFIDTAEGKSLDFVVAILGITRKTQDYAVGNGAFFRDPTVPGAITIPLGTRLKTDGVIFETTQERTLQPGFPRVDAPIRAAPGFEGDQGKVKPQTITQMVLPIAGISRVTNFDGTDLGLADETDEELRARAKAALKGVGKCTVDALRQAVLGARAKSVQIWDPDHPDSVTPKPGCVRLVVDAEAGRHAAIEQAVWATKTAGVYADILFSNQVKSRLTMSLVLDPGVSPIPAQREKVKQEVLKSLRDYVTGLGIVQEVEGEALLNAAQAHASVQRVIFKEVVVWRIKPDISDEPEYDQEAVQGAEGPATPQEIAEGKFRIVIGEKESIKLEMTDADIDIELRLFTQPGTAEADVAGEGA